MILRAAALLADGDDDNELGEDDELGEEARASSMRGRDRGAGRHAPGLVQLKLAVRPFVLLRGSREVGATRGPAGFGRAAVRISGIVPARTAESSRPQLELTSRVLSRSMMRRDTIGGRVYAPGDAQIEDPSGDRDWE